MLPNLHLRRRAVVPLTVVLLLLSFCTPGNAQLEDQTFHYGFFAGASKSSINDVQTTLIRPIFPTKTYNTSLADRWGVVVGSFVHYRFKKSAFAIEPQIAYQDGGGRFLYDDVEDLTYTLQFNYAHLKISPVVKYYLMHGLCVKLGPELGFIIDRSALRYTSNQPEVGPDLQIEQSLSEVLKGNNMVSLMMGIGYDLSNGLGIDFSYHFGISDAIETVANGFYFIENPNAQHSMAFTLSYAIPFSSRY